MQGTVFAPIKCSIQIDTLGRDYLTNGDGLYEYKSVVDVPVLSMVDDVIGITTCSDEAVKLNAIINVKMESKKLRLSKDKYYKLHISKKKDGKCSIILKTHEDKIKNVKSATYLPLAFSDHHAHVVTVELPDPFARLMCPTPILPLESKLK